MADYTGGYTSALDSAARRDFERVETQRRQQMMVQELLQFQQAQEAQRRKAQARAALGDMLPQLTAPPQGGPQPPMPGQPSVPMGPPPGAPPGGPPGVPPSPRPGMQFMTTPPPMGPGGTGGPQLKAAGGPPVAAAAPAGPAPWKGLPAPPQGAPAAPGGELQPPPEDAVMPRQLLSVAEMLKLLDAKGIKGEKAIAMLEEWKPFMDSENKRMFDNMKIETQAMRAAADFHRAETARLRERLAEKEFQEAKKPLAEARIGKLKGVAYKQEGSSFPKGEKDYLSMDPQSKDYDANKAAKQFADVQAAWNYILTRNLPYRKGTGGGADRNEYVKFVAAKEAMRFGYSPEEMATIPYEARANMQSLAFQQRKVDQLQAVMQSFENNLQTFDNIAKGKPIPFEKASDAAKQLPRINFVGVRSIDELKLKIQQQINDPSASALAVAAMTAGMDMARINQGYQSVASLTVDAMKHAQALLSVAMDDKARDAALRTLRSDAAGKITAETKQLGTIQDRMMPKPKAGSSAAGERGAPKPGTVDQGYRFKGGDPNDPKNWEKAA